MSSARTTAARFLALATILLALTLPNRPHATSLQHLPSLVLWAWERPEGLRFLDPTHTSIAFLAATVDLDHARAIIHPRLQPLQLPDRTPLIAVIRIETKPALLRRIVSNAPESSPLNQSQLRSTLAAITHAASLPRIAAIQIDFDATVSERPFYRKLLFAVRRHLPATPISITALASWCYDDDWLASLPIDEAVPMLFRMGADARNIRARLASGRDFREPLCRASLGLSTDEPWPGSLPHDRRLYVFSPQPWTPHTFQATLWETHAWR